MSRKSHKSDIKRHDVSFESAVCAPENGVLPSDLPEHIRLWRAVTGAGRAVWYRLCKLCGFYH